MKMEHTMTDWTKINNREAHAAALALARGGYQRSLINGHENLSGSTLKGKAKRYGWRYAKSRAALLARMTAAGVPWYEEIGAHNARILVIG